MKNVNRRRQYVVNKVAQKRIVVRMIWAPLLVLVTAAATVMILSWGSLDGGTVEGEGVSPLMQMVFALVVLVLYGVAVIAIQAFRHSHQVAGPAYRIVKSLEQLREGDLTVRVKLRPGDELIEIADELNRVLDWLREHPPEGCDFEPAQDEPTTASPADKTEPVEESALS